MEGRLHTRLAVVRPMRGISSITGVHSLSSSPTHANMTPASTCTTIAASCAGEEACLVTSGLQRALVACAACRSRKVRCDLQHQRSTSCTNCNASGIECTVLPKRFECLPSLASGSVSFDSDKLWTGPVADRERQKVSRLGRRAGGGITPASLPWPSSRVRDLLARRFLGVQARIRQTRYLHSTMKRSF